MKGEGDGQRNKIFANAFGKDPTIFCLSTEQCNLMKKHLLEEKLL